MVDPEHSSRRHSISHRSDDRRKDDDKEHRRRRDRQDDKHRSRHHHRSSRRSRSPDHERDSKRSSKHREDEDHRRHHSSRHRSHRRDEDHDRRRDKRREGHRSDNTTIVDDDEAHQEPDLPPPSRMEVDVGKEPSENFIPTSESLSLTSKQTSSLDPNPAPLPHSGVTESSIRRDDWMMSTPPAAESSASAGQAQEDYFSGLGSARVKKQKEEKPDPEKLQISSRELNTQLKEGKSVDQYADLPKERVQHGAPGHQWRMMKLKRVYEAAEEEKRPLEEVALERYASLEEFNEARAERQFLDDKGKGKGQMPSVSGKSTPIQNVTRRSFMFSDSPGPSSALGGPPSRPSSRQAFRRPGESSMPSTPQATTPAPLGRGSSFRQSGYETPGGRSDSSTKPSTPIPSVFTPVIQKQTSKSAEDPNMPNEAIRRAIQESQARDHATHPPLTANEFNKLQAKVMRAELMGAPDAEKLKEEFERESARAANGGDHGQGFFSVDGSGHGLQPVDGDGTTEIQVLPTLDGRGRLYDVGTGNPGEDEEVLPGNRKKKEKFETHDPKTGELLRYNKDDDQVTLADLVRQERFGAGAKDQKDLDSELATHIMRDTRYKDDEDYIDENAERLARKKMKTDAMKRQFAIQDFAKTKRALDTCIYCWQDEGSRPPHASVIASGTRVYLAMPEYESLTEGHCLIVPMHHHLSSLEAEDDTWDEIKNFMKCLIQMAAVKGESMVFYETVLSLKHQKHTYIEAVPVPADVHQVLPGVFKESLMMVEEEWSQNRKVIDFAKKPFRRSMVPQLPYFMVQWDYKGEKGYGHIIEKSDGALVDHNHADAFDIGEGSTGGDFPRWFAAEIIGNQLDLEPRRWRKPRKLDLNAGRKRMETFLARWKPFDWTRMLA